MCDTKTITKQSTSQNSFSTIQTEPLEEVKVSLNPIPVQTEDTVSNQTAPQNWAILENSFETGSLQNTSVPVLTKKEKEKLEKQKAENEEQRKTQFAEQLAGMDQSARYSAKERKKMMNKSDELNQKMKLKKKSLMQQRRETNASDAVFLKQEEEIIALESEARKEYSKALSLSQEQEDYLMQTEELRRLNRLEGLYGQCLQDQAYDDKMESLAEAKQKVRARLLSNGQFLAFRQKVVQTAMNQSENKDMQSIMRKAEELFGRDNTQLLSKEDFLQEIDQLLENDTTAAIDEMMNSLMQYKQDFGGCPNFGDEEPRLTREVITIDGHSLENRQAWARKLITRGNIFQQAYGHYLQHRFGRSQPESNYERIALYLHSMRNLALYKPFIMDAYEQDKNAQIEDLRKRRQKNLDRNRTDDTTRPEIYQKYFARHHKGHDLMLEFTRVSCHNNLNGAAIEMDHIESVLRILVEQYQLALRENRLKDFFLHLDGACFDDRVDLLKEYSREHPLPAEIPDEPMQEEVLPAPEDGSLYIKTQKAITDMDLHSGLTVQQAGFRVLDAIVKSNNIDLNLEPPTWAEIEPEMQRQLLHRTFLDINEEGMEKKVLDSNGVETTVPVEVNQDLLLRIKELMIISSTIDE